MNSGIILGVVTIVGIIGLLFVGFQLRDRLDKIASLLERR